MLAKIGRKSNTLKNFKNRTAFVLEDIVYMSIFAFIDEKAKDNNPRVALKFIANGIEEILYANTADEIAVLEKMFNTWVSLKDNQI
jgi:hypothetical protein